MTDRKYSVRVAGGRVLDEKLERNTFAHISAEKMTEVRRKIREKMEPFSKEVYERLHYSELGVYNS